MERAAQLMARTRRRGIRAGLALSWKQRYDTYIDSEAWRYRREEWAAEHLRRSPGPIVCAVCGQPWNIRRDDLHHVEYSRLGAEQHDDLMPLHRQAHDDVHDLLDRLRLRWRMPLHLANAHVLAVLRRRSPCPEALAAHPLASEG